MAFTGIFCSSYMAINPMVKSELQKQDLDTWCYQVFFPFARGKWMVWTCVEGMIEIVVLECFVGGPGGLGLLDMLQVSELPGIFAPLWRCLQRWLSERYVSRILLGLPGSCSYHLTCEKMKRWWLNMNMMMWTSLCKGQQWCLPTAPRRSLTTLLH